VDMLRILAKIYPYKKFVIKSSCQAIYK